MKRTVTVDTDLHELCVHGMAGFPLEVNHDNLQDFQEHFIRCHWHDELELSLLLEGSAVYHINGTVYENTAGQAVIINTAIPHMLAPKGVLPVKILTVIVHPSLLYGTLGTSIEREILRPYLCAAALDGIRMDASVPWQSDVLESIRKIDVLYTAETFAYKLKIKSILCDIFYEIITHEKEKLKPKTAYNAEELRRLQILLDYLHANYKDSISLSELAACILVTRESCCRFFKKMTGRTIFEYLEDYRIAQSLCLLREGMLSVSQISDEVGFSNPSRFAAAFRLRMGCSPAKYRKDSARI